MSKKLPFQNIYKLRTVAPTDAKSCFICFKPTENVLITLPSASTGQKTDFFYICKSHLSDKNFCSTKHVPDNIDDKLEFDQVNERILKLQKSKFKLQEKLRNLEKMEQDSASQLASLVSYFSKKGEKQEKEKEKDEALDSKEDLKNKLLQTRKELSQVTSELNELIELYTKYQLDAHYFQMRLKKYSDREKLIERAAKLKDPNYFPSVLDLPKPGSGSGTSPGPEA